MPIYEYKCNSCNKEFEALVMGGTLPECPTCDGRNLTRLMSACGFVSKATGSGGETTVKSSAGSGCGPCTSTNCGSCGVG